MNVCFVVSLVLDCERRFLPTVPLSRGQQFERSSEGCTFNCDTEGKVVGMVLSTTHFM